MKRILLAVFIFVIALASVETAVAFYDCVDKNGQRMITDNPPQGAKCKSMGGEEDAIPTDPQQTGAKLNDLYNRAMNAAEDRERSVGGAAAYHCLAEVIADVKSSGRPVNPKFWSLVNDAFDRKWSVGGLLNVVERAASVQSVNTGNKSSCTNAMYHSK